MSLILVNTSVISLANKPWTILQVTVESNTLSEFFRDTVWPRISDCNSDLQAVHVGHELNSLYHVPDTIVAVINSFGHFIPNHVTVISTELAAAANGTAPGTSQTAPCLSSQLKREQRRISSSMTSQTSILQFLQVYLSLSYLWGIFYDKFSGTLMVIMS